LWNGESVKKSDQDLVDERSLLQRLGDVYGKDRFVVSKEKMQASEQE